MQCNVSTCSTPSDQNHLWNCNGTCGRSFHAACIGIKRGAEEELTNFILPLCSHCRQQLRIDIEIRKIMQHQLESNHLILTHIKINDKTNQEALNELHSKITNLQEDLQKSAEIVNRIFTAIINQSPTTEITLEEVKKAIEESTAYQNQKLAESFGRIQEITSSHRDDIIKTIATTEKCPSDIILAVHDEVRALTSSINNNNEKSIEVHYKSIAEELNEIAVISNTNNEPESGWRWLGNHKHWKPDWTDFDTRQQKRRLQEKEAEKARRRQRKHRQQIQQQQQQQRQQQQCQRQQHQERQLHQLHQQQQQKHQQHQRHQQQQTNCNFDTGRNNRPSTPHFLLNGATKMSDKQLLDQARVEFSGHPTSASNNFINFQKGETINPYQKEKTPIIPPLNATLPQPTTTTTTPENTDSIICLDPMKPPIVRLTEQSALDGGRFLLARLHEPKVYENFRLYLAYLKDQPPNVCIDGKTSTNIVVSLASEGLRHPEKFMDIFLEFNASLGISAKDTLADLEVYRNYLYSKKIQHLQQTREIANKFYRPLSSSNFMKH